MSLTDFTNNYLYWVDVTLNEVSRVQLDGSGRRLMYPSSGNLSPTLAVYDTVLLDAVVNSNINLVRISLFWYMCGQV